MILNWLAELAISVLNLLPESPVQGYAANLTSFTTIMGYINYFIPVGGMLIIFNSYLAAVLVWYAVRWVLRLAQYID